MSRKVETVITTHTHRISLISVSILSSHLQIIPFPFLLFPFYMLQSSCLCILRAQPFSYPSFYFRDIACSVRTMQLLITQFSPVACHFLPLKPQACALPILAQTKSHTQTPATHNYSLPSDLAASRKTLSSIASRCKNFSVDRNVWGPPKGHGVQWPGT